MMTSVKDADDNVGRREARIWRNSGNNAFYEEIKAAGLQKLAVKAGLLTGCDVKALKPYWEGKRKVLDVNSAFGRVVGALLHYGFNGDITAVERCDAQYQYMKAQYQHKARLLHADLYDLLEIKALFDVVFFLWSGLADFSPEEQPTIIKGLAGLLEKNGALIIDTMPMGVKPLDTVELMQQSFTTEAENSAVCTYEPSYAEMQSYAEKSGLRISELIQCRTDTDRIRWLYVLTLA